MTTQPCTFTDESGDLLHVSTCQAGLHLVAEILGDLGDVEEPSFRAPLCIPAADVREVTAAMHAKAGLPDRWAELRDWLEARAVEFEDGSEVAAEDAPDLAAIRYARSLDYRGALRQMDELEAGQ